MFSMFQCLKWKYNNHQTEISMHVPFSMQQPISLTTWGWGCKDFMRSSSLRMSCKSFGEALSRSRVKRSREEDVRLLLESTAKLDQGRANPVYINLSTNFFRTVVKNKNKNNYSTPELLKNVSKLHFHVINAYRSFWEHWGHYERRHL